MPAVFGVLVWLWRSYNWELQQKNMTTTKTSDKSENALTKQKNSRLNYDRKHKQHLLQTEASPRCSNKQAWNRRNPSQLSIIGGSPHNYQQVIIPAHEGQLAALQFSPSGVTTRKYVNRLLSLATNFFGGNAMKHPLQGEMWKYMTISKTCHQI